MGSALLILFAYLLGSIPTGFILSSIAKVDIRQAGSGNIGATNVARVIGWKKGLLTLLGDTGKGFVPVLLSLQLGYGMGLCALVGLAAFLGHLYPVFLRFQGGKGVATALGVFLALAPQGTGLLVLLFCLVVALSRKISLGSLVTAGVAPLVFWLVDGFSPLTALSLVISLFVFIRHRENIQRLISGTEVGWRSD